MPLRFRVLSVNIVTLLVTKLLVLIKFKKNDFPSRESVIMEKEKKEGI
jgi:hypothetical protein